MMITYNNIRLTAYKLIYDFTNELPINPFKIASSFSNLYICTYRQYAKFYSINEREVIKKFNSDEGFLLKISNLSGPIYLLGYNQNKSEERIRFTIAHELGHFILKHNEKTNRLILNNRAILKKGANVFEEEANHFAKHLLVPFPIALHLKKEMKDFDWQDLSNIFKVNYQPANYIMSNLNNLGAQADKYFNSDIERRLLKSHKKSIEKILYKKNKGAYS